MGFTAPRVGAVLLAVAGVMWLFVNKSVGEGPTILTLSKQHGVTASDLLSLAAFAFAFALWVWPKR